VVGDTIDSDILMANDAGCRSVLIASQDPDINIKTKPDTIIKGINELPGWLGDNSGK